MSKTLTITPRISEKAYALSSSDNTYVFEVPLTSNKLQVKNAVEVQYKVKVADVRIAISKGKTKNTARRKKQSLTGKRNDIKKAYITLKPGNSLTIFEDV
jgi:large subunit ribosomal protein L23